MASNIRRLIENTRERLLSTDHNDTTALQHRAIIEAVTALALGTAYNASSERPSGVIGGFEVTAPGASFNVTVSPGLAVKKGTAPTGYDSDLLWIEQQAIETIDLSSLVDPGNPRWVVIEIEPTDAVETAATRDVFVPALGTFTSQSVDKVKGSDPTFTARGGTPAAAPVFPSGVADRIPLAYVYLAAAAASVEVGDVVRCRPMLNTRLGQGDHYNGGGVHVATDATSLVQAGHFRCSLDGLPFQMTLRPSTTQDINVAGNPSWASGDAYPAAATQPIYCYAIAAPYPTGYDADVAHREMVPGSGITTSARIPSVKSGMENCVLAFSDLPPASGVNQQQGIASGAAFAAGINDPTWGGGVPATSVYVGALSCINAQDLLAQDYIGAGEIALKTPGTGNQIVEDDVQNSGGLTLQTGDMRNLLPLTAGGAQVLPDTAHSVRARIAAVSAAPNQTWTVRLREDFADGHNIVISWAITEAGGTKVTSLEQRFWLHDDGGAGFFDWNHTEGSANDHTLQWVTVGYRDELLARRA